MTMLRYLCLSLPFSNGRWVFIRYNAERLHGLASKVSSGSFSLLTIYPCGTSQEQDGWNVEQLASSALTLGCSYTGSANTDFTYFPISHWEKPEDYFSFCFIRREAWWSNVLLRSSSLDRQLAKHEGSLHGLRPVKWLPMPRRCFTRASWTKPSLPFPLIHCLPIFSYV